MGLVRILLLALLVYVIWRLIRGALGQRGTPAGGRDSQRMQRCEHCGLNVPEQEALRHDGRHFCCLEHKQAWQDKQRD